MKIDPNISFDDFCKEMQHRVVRYSLRSIAVRSAIRFAKRHDDPEFYRMAINKIHAQKLFMREVNGPGLFERMFDYFSLGSLREVVVTLMLVGLAVVGIDAGRKWVERTQHPASFEQLDVDQLAKRLGILREDPSGSLEHASLRPILAASESDSLLEGNSSSDAMRRQRLLQLTDQDVQRIVQALLVAMDDGKGLPDDSAEASRHKSTSSSLESGVRALPADDKDPEKNHVDSQEEDSATDALVSATAGTPSKP